ncbi:site-specific DNA-methyltransferase, partial [Bacteroides clarus]|uniref:DNA methyltransferase n=2 Tax=Bacteroides TaxID=816 RepID=UPI002100CCDC
MNVNQIYNSECLQGLKYLPDNSIHCCVTSPPYYALRDYGDDAQIGLEKTPEEYIQKLVDVFREVRRVLTKDGTL